MTAVDFGAFVNELADVSGRTINPFFRSTLIAENKSSRGDFDPVTEADRAAESAMRSLIRRTFPAHGIEGEEFDDERPDAEYVWVLDPIDGTRAFISGLPLWGTLIGLKHHGHPAYGLMHQPFIGERFFGDGGESGYRRGGEQRVIRTRRCGELASATLASTSPRLFEGSALDAFDRVERACQLTRFGTDCYAYCLLAAGHIDLVVEAGLKACDIVPLVPIIEGAGGVITTWDGAPVTGGGAVVAAGDPRVHEQALELLARSAG
jgi:myo-inositol-1(or 4)-monophosphatase